MVISKASQTLEIKVIIVLKMSIFFILQKFRTVCGQGVGVVWGDSSDEGGNSGDNGSDHSAGSDGAGVGDGEGISIGVTA